MSFQNSDFRKFEINRLYSPGIQELNPWRTPRGVPGLRRGRGWRRAHRFSDPPIFHNPVPISSPTRGVPRNEGYVSDRRMHPLRVPCQFDNPVPVPTSYRSLQRGRWINRGNASFRRTHPSIGEPQRNEHIALETAPGLRMVHANSFPDPSRFHNRDPLSMPTRGLQRGRRINRGNISFRRTHASRDEPFQSEYLESESIPGQASIGARSFPADSFIFHNPVPVSMPNKGSQRGRWINRENASFRRIHPSRSDDAELETVQGALNQRWIHGGQLAPWRLSSGSSSPPAIRSLSKPEEREEETDLTLPFAMTLRETGEEATKLIRDVEDFKLMENLQEEADLELAITMTFEENKKESARLIRDVEDSKLMEDLQKEADLELAVAMTLQETEKNTAKLIRDLEDSKLLEHMQKEADFDLALAITLEETKKKASTATNLEDFKLAENMQRMNIRDSKEQGKDTSCAICMDKPSTHAYIPCGHRIVCVECSQSLKTRNMLECVICRKKAQNIIQIY